MLSVNNKRADYQGKVAKDKVVNRPPGGGPASLWSEKVRSQKAT